MSTPVIDTPTSIPWPYVGEPYGLQLTASNLPTSWDENVVRFVVTAVYTTGVFTATGNTFVSGSRVRFGPSATLPAGVFAGVDYYVRDISGSTFKLAATIGGAAITITTNGSGTNYIGYTNFPVGITINNAGWITGVMPGPRAIYNLRITCTNADPATSAVYLLTLAVDDRGGLYDGSVQLMMDIETGVVTPINPGPPSRASDPNTLTIFAKGKDKKLFSIFLTSGGNVVDIPIQSLAIGFKETEPDPLVALATGVTTFKGSGTSKRYLRAVDFSLTPTPGQSLTNVLANDEEDTDGPENSTGLPQPITGFDGLMEIQVVLLIDPAGGIDLQPYPVSSQTILARIERNLLPAS